MSIDSGLPEGPRRKQPWWRQQNYLEYFRKIFYLLQVWLPRAHTINNASLQMLGGKDCLARFALRYLALLPSPIQTINNVLVNVEGEFICFLLNITRQMHKAWEALRSGYAILPRALQDLYSSVLLLSKTYYPGVLSDGVDVSVSVDFTWRECQKRCCCKA